MNLLRIPRTVRNIQRFRQIAKIVVEYGFEEFLIQTAIADRWWVQPFRSREDPGDTSMPSRFVEMLERLGPSFIKLGQILSTRADIFPEAWVTELSRLQDTVLPVPFAQLKPVIETATGPISETFRTFDESPLASASVGQVHAAVLQDGREVVVKVVRPGMRIQVGNDVEIMRVFAQLAEQQVPELTAFRPTGIVDEFERAIVREMDLRKEARNIERFRNNFADDERIVVPDTMPGLSDRDVLVMERLYGERITDYDKLGNDPRVLARLGIEMVLKMAFLDGFFHADPHPGNIWTMPGNRIALLDMGMADFVMPDTRDVLVDLMVGVATDDPDQLVDAVLRPGRQPDELDLNAFRRDLVLIYEDYVRGASLADINIGELAGAAIEAGRKHRIVIPTDITMLLKGLGTIEGIGKQLDPELDIVTEVRPYVMEIISRRWGPDRLARDVAAAGGQAWELLLSLPRRLDNLLDKAERGQLRTRQEIEGLSYGFRVLERTGNRLTVAILVACLTFAGATLWNAPLFEYRSIPIGASILLLAAGGLGALVVLSVLRHLRSSS